MQAVLSEVDVTAPSARHSLGHCSCIALSSGNITHPNQLDDGAQAWLPAMVPGTAASALHTAGLWDFDRPTDVDSSDWWFRTAFALPQACNDEHSWRLCFDG